MRKREWKEQLERPLGTETVLAVKPGTFPEEEFFRFKGKDLDWSYVVKKGNLE